MNGRLIKTTEYRHAVSSASNRRKSHDEQRQRSSINSDGHHHRSSSGLWIFTEGYPSVENR